MMTENRSSQTLVFHCSNAVGTHDLMAALCSRNITVPRIVSLPCSGKIDLLYLLKAFEKGVENVLLITCPRDGCSYLEGSMRAHKRADAVNHLLAEIGHSGAGVTVMPIKETGLDDVLDVLEHVDDAVTLMNS